MKLRRLDDPTAIVDHALAHATAALALAVVVVALAVPSLRGALGGGAIVGIVAVARLAFHPLRFARLSRVFVDERSVVVASLFGRPKRVRVVRVDHDRHAPWPCALHLDDGGVVTFVARRDSGFPALLDLEISDRARYERPLDARDSLTEIEVQTRRAA